MAGSAYYSHPAVLAHDVPGHPERPDRIRALEAGLEARDWLGWERRPAPMVAREALHRVHPPAYVDAIEAACAEGVQIDPDTVALPATWEAACRASGAAVAMVDALLDGDISVGFCGTRPPGHHAERARAMGFCYFGHVAVAAEHARRAHGLERVAVVDWDVHHGNGTAAIFAADRRVLVASVHEWPLYPGTGSANEAGTGAGAGFTVNLPVPSGSGDAVFGSMIDHVVVPVLREFAPELVLVSAGFDAHRDDPLAGCTVTADGFAGMAASLAGVAGELGVPLGAVLEGGYALDALTSSVCAALPALAGTGTGRVAMAQQPHGLALEARARLARWWPSLGEPAPGQRGSTKRA